MSPRMADIRVHRPHGVTKEAAMQVALNVAERLKDKAQASYRVQGDVIEFERPGAKGKIVVGDTNIVAEVTLGFMLKPMRGMIESKIDEYFTRYLKA
jgi:putative polyhydroxyalkanoate system protein